MTGARILILEDDPSVADLYARALREDGHEVIVCTRFEDARQHLRGDRPECVLTDVRVGEYNGLQLGLLFRRYSPDGQLVVVTGYDDEVIRKDVDQLNGEFLLKPVRIAQLRRVFAEHRRLPIALALRLSSSSAPCIN
jgi:two-component system response regulator RegA